ncbi:MAG: hypothetical protein M1165_02280 [Candidatus Pacearchaeota archaeon]|nr:hypothetical protein [Candidatus Pacearchaeota archaeon]
MNDIIRIIPFSELEEKIRQVPLMSKDPPAEAVYVYRNASITLKQLHPQEVNPPTFYLVRKNLEIQRQLMNFLAEKEIDYFNLPGGLELTDETGGVFMLTPPIVEVSHRDVRYAQQEGEINHENKIVKINIPLIADGAHRFALAHEMGKNITAIYISGVDERFPYYAHPNAWEDVVIMDEVPKTMEEKKLYRMENSYALFRNFDAVGLGGRPRFTGR